MRFAASIGAAAVMMLLAACANQPDSPQGPTAGTPDNASEATPDPSAGAGEGRERIVTISASRWGGSYSARALDRMVRASPTILVGRVTGVTIVYPYRGQPLPLLHSDEEEGEPPPPGHPKATVTIVPDPSYLGPPGSLFDVEVLRVVRSSPIEIGGVVFGFTEVKAGDTITVSQLGGLVDGVVFQDESDPIIRVGSTYLYFLGEPEPGTFTSDPFERFIVDGGKLQPVNRNASNLEGVKALAGLPVDAAQATIEAALAAAPAPTPQP
ncbi:MAG: hypothetical protein Q8Q00_14300 [Dehalococcoidia bacterium]|nr:hypothetical protein [Dehalococcoidia bacterium]